MQAGKSVIKQETFRQGGSWQDICKIACMWVNTNINLKRLVGITSVLCHYNNQNLVYLVYDQGAISEDILQQTRNLVLSYEILYTVKTIEHSWQIHNKKLTLKVGQIVERGEIVAVNSLEHDTKHQNNVTIVWYRRTK